MKILFNLILFCAVPGSAHGQADTVFIRFDKNKFGEEKIEYKTDTIVFETPTARAILHGTAVLPWTSNQQYAVGYGLYLEKVEIAPCRKGERPKEREEVISAVQTDTTLTMQLNILGNCCHSFLCDIQVMNDTTINLIQYGYGATYCACICCFGLTYEFSIVREYSEFDKLKNVMINGDKRTLKRLK